MNSLKQKIFVFVLVALGLFFLNSFVDMATREKIKWMNDVVVEHYQCKSQKHNSFNHIITLATGEKFYNITHEACKFDEFSIIIELKKTVNITTDEKGFYQVMYNSQGIFDLLIKNKSVKKSKQAALLVALIFFFLAGVLYIKDRRRKK